MHLINVNMKCSQNIQIFYAMKDCLRVHVVNTMLCGCAFTRAEDFLIYSFYKEMVLSLETLLFFRS